MMKKLPLLLLIIYSINFLAQNSTEQVRAFQNIEEGLKAPDLKVDIVYNPTDIEDISLEKLKGKIIIIEFWATWCRPCLKMFPHFNNLVTIFKDKDVVFISVSGDKGKNALSNIKKTLKKHPLKTIVVSDNTGTTTEELYGPVIFPSTILLDKNGNIEAITNPNMVTEKTITKMLNNKPSGLKGIFIKELMSYKN